MRAFYSNPLHGETACELWREKLAFLESEYAATTHPLAKFEIKKRIEEARSEIERLCDRQGHEPPAAQVDWESLPSHGTIPYIDFSHGQDRWEGFYGKGYNIFKNIKYVPLESMTADSGRLVERSRVLILPMPYHHRITDGEVDFFEQWVSLGGRGLLLMGSYIGDLHHGTNMNRIARRFHFQFFENLIMPRSATSDRECNHQAFATNNPSLTAFADVEQTDHPLSNGVAQLAFLSSCSISLTASSPEFRVESYGAEMVPMARRRDDGTIVKIEQWDLAREINATMFAAWQYGHGRVAASGTWKILTLPLGQNVRFADNLIGWLSRDT